MGSWEALSRLHGSPGDLMGERPTGGALRPSGGLWGLWPPLWPSRAERKGGPLRNSGPKPRRPRHLGRLASFSRFDAGRERVPVDKVLVVGASDQADAFTTDPADASASRRRVSENLGTAKPRGEATHPTHPLPR